MRPLAPDRPLRAVSCCSRYRLACVQREITPARAIGWMLALTGSAAALSLACLQFFADQEQRAMLFAIGGLALAVWAASHLTDHE